jgi:hypothetical protein
MRRTVVVAIITLAAITLPVETSLAFGRGGASHSGPPRASVGHAHTYVPPTHRGGPYAKKIRGHGMCYSNCIRGMGTDFIPFCSVSCY